MAKQYSPQRAELYRLREYARKVERVARANARKGKRFGENGGKR